MTRTERTLRAAGKAEMKAIRSAIRATEQANAWGHAAIRAGQAAERFWLKAAALRRIAEDREAAAKREPKKRKMAKDWYKRPQRAV